MSTSKRVVFPQMTFEGDFSRLLMPIHLDSYLFMTLTTLNLGDVAIVAYSICSFDS